MTEPVNQYKSTTDKDTIAALRENLKAANQLLQTLGWYPFGYHADQRDVQLTFSQEKWNDTGFPFYERTTHIVNPNIRRQREDSMAQQLFRLCDPRGGDYWNIMQSEEKNLWIRRARQLIAWVEGPDV